MNYAVEMESCDVIHIDKIGSAIQKLLGGYP
jgi:hypothetical protein